MVFSSSRTKSIPQPFFLLFLLLNWSLSFFIKEKTLWFIGPTRPNIIAIFFNRNTYLIFPLSITKYYKTKMYCSIFVTPCASFSLYPFYQSCPPPPPPLLLLLSLKKSIRINLTGERRRRGCRLSSFRQAKASTNSVPLFPNFILYLPAKSLPPVPSLIGRVSETLIVLWERERET